MSSADIDLQDFEEDFLERIEELEKCLVSLEAYTLLPKDGQNIERMDAFLELARGSSRDILDLSWNANFPLLQEASYLLEVLIQNLQSNIDEELFNHTLDVSMKTLEGLKVHLEEEMGRSIRHFEEDLYAEINIQHLKLIAELITEISDGRSKIAETVLNFISGKTIALLLDDDSLLMQVSEECNRKGLETIILESESQIQGEFNKKPPIACILRKERVRYTLNNFGGIFQSYRIGILLIDDSYKTLDHNDFKDYLYGLYKLPVNLKNMVEDINLIRAEKLKELVDSID